MKSPKPVRTAGRRTTVRTRAAIVAALAVSAALGTGCDVKSFIDPSELGRYEKLPANRQPLMLPILRKLDTAVEEPNDQFVTAVDVVPADLIVTGEDYRVERNDTVQVQITDLIGIGVVTERVVKVSESGQISLPSLDPVNILNLTEREAEDLIGDAYVRANLLTDPEITVTVLDARGRIFSVYSSTGSTGQFVIPRADFRLLDALVLTQQANTGGVDFAYVVRQPQPQNAPAAPVSPADPMPLPTGTPEPTPGPDILEPQSRNHVRFQWRIDQLQPRMLSMQDGTTATQPAANPEGRYIELDGRPVLIGGNGAATDPLTPVEPTTAPTTAPSAEALPSDALTGAAPAEGAIPGVTTAPSGEFEFQDINTENEVRIIRVPLEQLRRGDLSYNIVIKPNDLIIIPAPETGVYYMGGHVQRTGVYNLTGQKITLKQAIVGAGMLDAVAIPQRTDIIRRIGTDQEIFVRIDLDAIFSGKQPDLFLKPNDTVMVGTNFFAPFIAAIRGGFRFSYGFGFLYDRNFYDDDNENNN